ncbi:enoyl-CoA hydratase/isomerase family protein [Halobacteriales archaeon SW_5_70_135]|nr:MAG: enoyl-CoA hydratase/isomerase family protein [Halobacteriales archaeon SW_5_70_135]
MVRRSEYGALTEITLDRPDRRNALTPAGLDALGAAVEAAEGHVLYLHGAGQAFCAGADLETVDALDRAGAVGFARQGQRVARDLATADAAVVAGIDGAARGGGVELALACDLRVATPEATLAETGVSLGLFGAWGGTHRLPRAVGRADAFDVALTGRTLDAREARRAGLVSRVTENPRAVAETVADHDAAAVLTVAERLRDDATPRAQERREATTFGRLVEGCAERDGTN